MRITAEHNPTQHSSKDRIIFSLEYLAREAKIKEEGRMYCILKAALFIIKNEEDSSFLEEEYTSITPENHEDIFKAANFLLKFMDVSRTVQQEVMSTIVSIENEKYDA